MVRGNIGKQAIIIVNALHPVHLKALRGNLHHRMAAAFLHHLAKGLVKLIGFRSGIDSRAYFISNGNADGADHAHLMACCLQTGLYHMGCCGLSFRAGNPDHYQLPCRMIKAGC